MGDTLTTCMICGILYDVQSSIGLLECCIHPLRYNRDREGNIHGEFQYDCCGNSNENSKGCHAIDHVANENELKHVMLVPYTIMIKEDAERALEVVKRDLEDGGYGRDQYLIPVNSGSILVKRGEVYRFRTCPLIPLKKLSPLRKHESVEKIMEDHSYVEIDVKSHQENMKKCIFEANSYTGNKEEDSFLSHYYFDKTGNLPSFIPFYIIRRMDFSIMP